MRYFLLITAILLICSCKKDELKQTVMATVQQKGGCFGNSWLVLIEDPDPDRYSFICKTSMPPGSSSSFNCTNSIYIVNLPASMAKLGTRISFSGWKELASCLSSSFAATHVEAYNIKER